jgi:D-arabinose 1-dehydrogenase-like Zn-dependent alcohol dehydrogenase
MEYARSYRARSFCGLRALLAEAVEAHVQPHTTAYALTDANRGLHDMKRSKIGGTPVLAIA